MFILLFNISDELYILNIFKPFLNIFIFKELLTHLNGNILTQKFADDRLY